jgi:hypothetical protein
VIAENNLVLEDFDFDDDDDDYMGEADEDAVMAALEDAYAQEGSIETAIHQVQSMFPNVHPGTIDAMADLVAEFENQDRVSGPPSMRPTAVNNYAASIRTSQGYN